MAVECAVVGRCLGRGVDSAGALVDGRPATTHAAAATTTAHAPSAVNGGERHVGVLVLYLRDREKNIADMFGFLPCCGSKYIEFGS